MNDLQQALDGEFAPVVKDGLLKDSTGWESLSASSTTLSAASLLYGAAHPDSIFEIGSVTKTLTGLALAQLAAQGKVRLDEPVRPILFPNLAAAPMSAEITLLDLVTHRSGLPSVPGNLVPGNPANPFADYNPVALREFFDSRGMQRPANAKYSYSSFGIALLGFALAQREGVSYSQLIRNEITGPLRMNDTVFALSPDQARRLSKVIAPIWMRSRLDGEMAGSSPARSAQNRRSKTCSSISMRISIPIATRRVPIQLLQPRRCPTRSQSIIRFGET